MNDPVLATDVYVPEACDGYVMELFQDRLGRIHGYKLLWRNRLMAPFRKWNEVTLTRTIDNWTPILKGNDPAATMCLEIATAWARFFHGYTLQLVQGRGLKSVLHRNGVTVSLKCRFQGTPKPKYEDKYNVDGSRGGY